LCFFAFIEPNKLPENKKPRSKRGFLLELLSQPEVIWSSLTAY
jgi:hypothetical protein